VLLVAATSLGCDGGGLLPGDDGSDTRNTGPAIVRLHPAGPAYRVGEIVAIAVEIENARDVGSVPFHLHYDSSVLRFEPPAEEGEFMGEDGAATVFLASERAGGGEVVVGISRLSAAVGARGAGLLATLRFVALTPGPCGFEFTAASVKDPLARNLPAAFETARVVIQP
jgi:hypothetical protein